MCLGAASDGSKGYRKGNKAERWGPQGVRAKQKGKEELEDLWSPRTSARAPQTLTTFRSLLLVQLRMDSPPSMPLLPDSHASCFLSCQALGLLPVNSDRHLRGGSTEAPEFLPSGNKSIRFTHLTDAKTET